MSDLFSNTALNFQTVCMCGYCQMAVVKNHAAKKKSGIVRSKLLRRNANHGLVRTLHFRRTLTANHTNHIAFALDYTSLPTWQCASPQYKFRIFKLGILQDDSAGSLRVNVDETGPGLRRRKRNISSCAPRFAYKQLFLLEPFKICKMEACQSLEAVFTA